MGSPDFSVPALRALHAAGHEIVCVYSQPPKPAGRGQRETPCPVHRAALGWLPLTQQRDLSKAPTLTLSSSSIAVRALRDVLCPRPPPSLVHFDAHMHGVRLLARTQPALCDGNRSRAGCTSLR